MFARQEVFNEVNEMVIPGWTSLLKLLNASCLKKHEYIWVMGGDLDGFQGTELFYKMKRVRGWWGMSEHTGGNFHISVTKCVLSLEVWIYIRMTTKWVTQVRPILLFFQEE